MVYAFHDYQMTAIFYLLGQGMDAIDGVVARHFGQSTAVFPLLDASCS